MLTQTWPGARILSSRALTPAIILCVVLINSVAWGIPLLLGMENRVTTAGGAIQITTGALSKPPSVDRRQVNSVSRPIVPLPRRAPIRQAGRVALSDKAAERASGAQAPKSTSSAPSGIPSTLFPRPVPRLALNEERKPEAIAIRGDVAKQVFHSQAKRRHVRDVVLVSPYTPGVRISPNRHGHGWRHRNPIANAGQTTLSTAKDIALRAARRFEEMRDRMAKLDARTASGHRESKLNRQLLRPVVSQPPRIAGQTSGLSDTRSSQVFVRARLVRRPIVGARVSQQTPETQTLQTQAAELSRHQTIRSGASKRPSSNQRRLARLTPPPVSNKTKRVRRTILRGRTKVRRGRVRRAKQQRSRTARRVVKTRQTKRRDRSRKVNGFRRGFHRQLVAANFFGSSN